MTTATSRIVRRRTPSIERGLAALSKEDRKLYESIKPEPDYVPHPDYRRVSMEHRLFGPEAKTITVHRWRHFPQVAGDDVVPAEARRKLSREDEAELFMRYNYARYRVATLMSQQRRRFSAKRVGEVLKWYRQAMANRAALVGANMPLVVAMGKRTRINTVEFGELISEGNMALMRAVDKFDVSRGFKFSTYGCRAILKSFSRLVTKTSNYRQRFPTEFVPELEKSDELDRRREGQRELAIEDLQRVLGRNTAALSDVEKAVVGARFAVSGYSARQTLEQVGHLVGLSKERVRQVQNGALAKLRVALDKQVA